MQIDLITKEIRDELAKTAVISSSFKETLLKLLDKAVEEAYKQGLQEQTMGMCFTVKGEDSILYAMDKFKAQCGKTPDELRIHPVDIHRVLYYSDHFYMEYPSSSGLTNRTVGKMFGMKVVEDSSILDGTAYLIGHLAGRSWMETCGRIY